MTEPKFSLVDYSPADAKTVLEELDAVLVKYDGQFVVTPVINPNGTIGAKAEVFKKVELVPKSVETPYLNEEPDTKAEEGSEGSVAEPA